MKLKNLRLMISENCRKFDNNFKLTHPKQSLILDWYSPNLLIMSSLWYIHRGCNYIGTLLISNFYFQYLFT